MSATGMRGLSRPTRSKAALEALAQVEESLGGRDEVLAQLTLVDDPAANRLVELMTDPKRAGSTLIALAADAGIAPSSVLSLLRDASFTKALATAQLRMGHRLSNVVDRVLDAAEGSVAKCTCTIGGTEDPLPTCPKCRGTGNEYRRPSLEHQRMIFEATEVLKKSGPMVQVNQGMVANSGNQAGQSVDFFDTVIKGLAQVSKTVAPPRLTARAERLPPTDPIEGTLVEVDPPTETPL